MIIKAKVVWGIGLILGASFAGCGRDEQRPVKSLSAKPTVAPHDPQPPEGPEEPTDPTAEVVYPLDGTLRLNQLQMLGSHNSYHVSPQNPSEPWMSLSLPPLAEQAAKYGVRQFELDVHFDGTRYLVFHLPGEDQVTTCFVFKDCLWQLLDWSQKNPGHHPLVVFFELKDEWDPIKIPEHIFQLEDELRSVWPREKLIIPDDVKGNYASIAQALSTTGWPTLAYSRGKTLFVILNQGDGRYTYTKGNQTLAGRSMFVIGEPGWPFCAILSIDDLMVNETKIRDSVKAGYLVRTHIDDLPGRGEQSAERVAVAYGTGAHMIATDYPIPGMLADYDPRVPGGTPSRCNPRTAPGNCTSGDIENPKWLQQVTASKD